MDSVLRGIVLRRTNQGESDRRLTLFSLEQGKIYVTAKGSRKATGRLSAFTEPLTVAKFSLAESKRGRFLTQAIPESAYRSLRLDYNRLSVALATIELFDALLPLEQPDPVIFQILETTLKGIDEKASPIAASLWGQVHLMDAAGFAPDWRISAISGQEVTDTDPWFSPQMGGLIRDDERENAPDGYRMPTEVLFGIRRLLERDSPPENLKRALDTLIALGPWWRHIADLELKAFDSLVDLMKADLNSSSAM